MMLSDQLKNTNLPWWIKDHTFFKGHSKIYKIFPEIGMPNSEEYIAIERSQAENDNLEYYANELLQFIKIRIAYLNSRFNLGLDNLVAQVPKCISYKNGICELKLQESIYIGDKISYKKGSSIIKIYNKLKKSNPGYNLPLLEDNSYFKEFSKCNISQKKYKIGFYSSGIDGIMNIATISMRGTFVSCQRWEHPQARALIGSIINRYVGVVILSNDDATAYGSKIICRAMVAYVINSITKKPGLMFYNCYPTAGTSSFDTAMIRYLEKISKLQVINRYQDSSWVEFYLPEDTYTAKFLAQSEDLYLDSKIYNRHEAINANNTTRTDSITAGYAKRLFKRINECKYISSNNRYLLNCISSDPKLGTRAFLTHYYKRTNQIFNDAEIHGIVKKEISSIIREWY